MEVRKAIKLLQGSQFHKKIKLRLKWETLDTSILPIEVLISIKKILLQVELPKLRKKRKRRGQGVQWVELQMDSVVDLNFSLKTDLRVIWEELLQCLKTFTKMVQVLQAHS